MRQNRRRRLKIQIQQLDKVRSTGLQVQAGVWPPFDDQGRKSRRLFQPFLPVYRGWPPCLSSQFCSERSTLPWLGFPAGVAFHSFLTLINISKMHELTWDSRKIFFVDFIKDLVGEEVQPLRRLGLVFGLSSAMLPTSCAMDGNESLVATLSFLKDLTKFWWNR